MTAALYTVKVVDGVGGGTVIGTFAKAKAIKPGWARNKPAILTFETETLDPDNASLLPMDTYLDREVQVWRTGMTKPLWWGRPLQPQATKDKLVWTCEDLLSYFDTRTIGKPRTNYLTNGGFDADAVGTFPPTGWTAHGITGADAATVNNNQISGGLALQMNNATAGTDKYVEQTVSGITANDSAPFIFSGWGYSASAHWVGPALGELGLYVLACDAGGNVLNAYWDGGLVQAGFAQDQWQYLSVLCGRPAGVDHYKVRAMAPAAWFVWDDLSLVLPESLSYPRTDQGEMLESLSVHAQDVALGKSDLNIGRSHTTTGIERNRTFPFEDHRYFLAAMQEYTGIDQGVDISVAWTNATARTFTVHWPSRGTTRTTELHFRSAASSNCSAFTLQIDGKTVATSVTAVGPGSGPAREEATASDTAIISVILEKILQLPAGAGIGEILATATAGLAEAKKAVYSLSMTTADVTLVDAWAAGTLGICDILPVIIDWGWVQINESMQITDCVLDSDGEALILTLNRTPATASHSPHAGLTPWLVDAAARIQRLEQIAQPTIPKAPVYWQVFNLNGALTVTEADPWPVPDARVLTHVNVHLKTAGTTNTVVTFYRDGVSIGTVTLGSGVTDLTVAMIAPFGTGAAIKAGVTTVGSGAAGIVITPITELAQAA